MQTLIHLNGPFDGVDVVGTFQCIREYTFLGLLYAFLFTEKNWVKVIREVQILQY